MSYRIGVGPRMARIGIAPCEPAIFCDGCGLVRMVVLHRMGGAPGWFMDGKAPPRWKQGKRLDNGQRQDFCLRCK